MYMVKYISFHLSLVTCCVIKLGMVTHSYKSNNQETEAIEGQPGQHNKFQASHGHIDSRTLTQKYHKQTKKKKDTSSFLFLNHSVFHPVLEACLLSTQLLLLPHSYFSGYREDLCSNSLITQHYRDSSWSTPSVDSLSLLDLLAIYKFL